MGASRADFPDPTHPGARPAVIFVGLDGAEPDLLLRWIDEGALPALAALRRDGLCEPVESPAGFGDGATWPSLITGVSPARHGRFFRRQFKPRSYRRTEYSVDADLHYEPFWTHMRRAGRRTAVLDVPFAPCRAEADGLLLVDWFIHDRYGPLRSWPPGYADAVRRRYGDDPIGGNSDAYPKDPESLQRLIRLLIERVQKKTLLVTETLRERRWDMLATAFTEPHDLGHVAWHLHDPTHPQHDAQWRARFGDPLKALYVQIDRALGDILAAAPSEASIVVFAGLGMGPNYTASTVMDEIVARLDDRAGPSGSRFARRATVAGAPPFVRRVARKIDAATEMLALSRRRFFALPHTENSGAIRINLKGREPVGRVAPGDFDEVCETLTQALLDLRDPTTHLPIVAQVVRVDRHMQGEHIDAMPDLLAVWNRQAPFSAVESSRIGRIDGVRSWGRTGDHTPHALMLVRSPEAGTREPGRPARVVDIAPTIAALQGVPFDGIDGVALFSRPAA